MNTQFTLKQVVEFCAEHRGAKAFPGFTYDQIAGHIVTKATAKRLVIVYDEVGICGACTYDLIRSYLYINHIVAIRSGFKRFVKEVRERFSGLTLIGQRGNRTVIYSNFYE